MTTYSIAIANSDVPAFEEYINSNYEYEFELDDPLLILNKSRPLLILNKSRPLVYAKVYELEMSPEQYSFIALKFKLLKHVSKIIEQRNKAK